MQYLGAVSKMTEWSQFVCIQHRSNPSLCPNHCCQRSWSWPVLWRPTRPFRTNTKNNVFFIIGDWNEKVESQEMPRKIRTWPWSTKWSRSKANRVLTRGLTGHSKHPLLTTQEKTLHMDITRWSISKSDWLYYLQPKMQKVNTVSKNKIGSWLWLRSWTPYCQIQT